MSQVVIEPVSAAGARRVLRMTLAMPGQSAADLERQVNGFMDYARQMSLDMGLQWLYRVDGQALTACTAVVMPGKTANLLLPSGDVSEADPAITADLVNHVIRDDALSGVRLAQCLIHTDDEATRAALLRAGFREIATLLYLEHSAAPEALQPIVEVPPGIAGGPVEWVTYGAETHPAFADLLTATYVDTLDCPGLTGLRDIEDILLGHKSSGKFLARRWLLLRCHAKEQFHCTEEYAEEPRASARAAPVTASLRARPNNPVAQASRLCRHRRDGGATGVLGRTLKPAPQAAACILFGENPLRPALELVYMGVHPSFRGRGVGRFVLQHGLRFAHQEGFSIVTLAVDKRNEPALKLYRNAGFRPTISRRAMIRPLHSNPCSS